MTRTARAITTVVALAALTGCSLAEPSGTVSLNEDEFAATLEEAEQLFSPVVSVAVDAAGGEVTNPGSGAKRSRCDEAYGDNLVELRVSTDLVTDADLREESLVDAMEPQMESLGWNREVNPSTERSRFVRTTETEVSLSLFVSVVEARESPGESEVWLSVSGSCMRLPASPFELGY